MRGRQVTILLLEVIAIHRHCGMIHAGGASLGLSHSVTAGYVDTHVRRIGTRCSGKALVRAAY